MTRRTRRHTHDQARQPDLVGHRQDPAKQRPENSRGGPHGVLQNARLAPPDEHRAGTEAPAAERGEIQMTARRRIRIEQHLEPAIEDETVPRPVGHHPPAGPARCLEQHKRPPGRGQHLRARQTRQPRADNNRHRLVNTSPRSFEQIFLAPIMLPLSLLPSSCTRSHL